MADCISREAAILTLLEKGQSSRRYKLGQIWELDFFEIREAIATIPSADVVEVVRCKDCVHRPIVIDVSKPYGYGITGPKENGDTDFTCPYLCDDEYYNGRMPKDDWYCSKGERRTGNGK